MFDVKQNDYTICINSTFVCFVRFSEHTAIIFLYTINWLVLITEVECVYCAVQTESSIIIIFNPYPANVDNMASSYQC